MLELGGADEGEDHSQQHVDEAHDAEGLEARLLHGVEQVHPAIGGLAPKEAAQGDEDETQILDAVVDLFPRGQGDSSDPLEEQGLDFVLGRLLALGSAGEEVEEASEPGGQRRVVHRDAPVGGRAVHGTGVEEETGIPGAESARVHHHAGGPAGVQLAHGIGRIGQRGLDPPLAPEGDAESPPVLGEVKGVDGAGGTGGRGHCRGEYRGRRGVSMRRRSCSLSGLRIRSARN